MGKSVLNKTAIERLELFNETVEELLGSGLVKEIAEKPHSFDIKFGDVTPEGRQKISTYERRGYDSDYVQSAVLKIRLFTNDGREKISLRKMDELYQSLPIDKEYKDNIAGIRKQTNDYLKENCGVWELPSKTHSDIFDTITYGMIIHKNKGKRSIVKQWQKSGFLWQQALYDFESTVRRLSVAMKIVQNNNVAILKQYG